MRNPFFKKAAVLLLTLLLFCGVLNLPSFADADMRRIVIGADLTDEQINTVYSLLEMKRGEITELRLSNQEERKALEGYVESAVIGTRSMSCVYLELMPQGSGISVITKNISWCTPEMYRSALTTAGIQDARLAVAAPFSVSGTAGLAGVYKAYEDMTGQHLNDVAKDVSTQELTITGELANEIGSQDSASIVGDLKKILNETVNMTDDEVRSTIRKIAGTYHVELTDAQVEQLLNLCRSLERLDPGSLTQKVEDFHDTLEKVTDAKDQVVGVMHSIRQAIESVRSFFQRLNGLFGH